MFESIHDSGARVEYFGEDESHEKMELPQRHVRRGDAYRKYYVGGMGMGTIVGRASRTCPKGTYGERDLLAVHV